MPAESVRESASVAKKPRRKPNQHKRFVEAVREIGADEERSAADELPGRLAKMPPEPRRKPKTERAPTKKQAG
jgi:hypothetical protein